MTVEINGSAVADREMLHDLLAKELMLPDYYGRNLDALYDLLMEISQPTAFKILHPDLLREHLGSYCEAFAATLVQASQNNPRVTVELI